MRQETPPTQKTPAPPGRVGLYDPALEHDACGLALIVRYRGPADHEVVDQALTALRKLEHRGGIGSDEGTGDGAGITLQIPHDYFSQVLADQGVDLPAPGEYAVGIGFFSQDYREDLIGSKAAVSTETTSGLPQPGTGGADAEADTVARIAAEEGLRVLAVRDVPHDESVLGEIARTTQPRMRQVFFAL
ncbi:MAG TPA: glutamate synthase subunit alpha, partial [Brevibacterium sp.]|nr:glutamate synthase subunit alpha [Brevibacterium sp.]